MKFIFIFLVYAMFFLQMSFAERIYYETKGGASVWADKSVRFYEYNNKNKIIHFKEERGDSINFECWNSYDSLGKLTYSEYKDVDGSKSCRKYRYNENLLIEEEYTDNISTYKTWYEYDYNGFLVRKKESNGFMTYFKNDSNGRAIEESYSTGSNVLFHDYDEKGNLIHTYCGAYDAKYEYDENGKVIYCVKNGNESFFEYEEIKDKNGNIVKMIIYTW